MHKVAGDIGSRVLGNATLNEPLDNANAYAAQKLCNCAQPEGRVQIVSDNARIVCHPGLDNRGDGECDLQAQAHM